MKILMFFPGRIQHLPPLVTAAACMADSGAQVRVVALSSTTALADYLRGRGVELILLRDRHPHSRLGKALLRCQAFSRLMREQRKMRPDCVWHHQSHFVAWQAWFPRLASQPFTVMHSHELTCHVWLRWKAQKALARRAQLLITPEANRALILKHLSGSKAPLSVVPNRPRADAMPKLCGPTRTTEAFRQHGGASECRRFLVYQGAFMPGRCLEHVIRGFQLVPTKEAGLILMGGDPVSSTYKQLSAMAAGDQRIAILPRITPPQHLQITAGCVGGILLYAPTTLNNIYCAPNKVFEYALFGLGMILPDSPGVTQMNHEYQLGFTCDPTDPRSIARAMTALLQSPSERYKQACDRFLASTSCPTATYRQLHTVLKRAIRENHGRAA
jgi:glycosyltransferase involved in cell wall biosynthesis